MRKPLFVYFRPPILASKINKEIMFFKPPFMDLMFLILSRFFPNIVDLGTPSKSSGRQNPPTQAGGRRCQIKECRISPNCHNLGLDGPPGLLMARSSRSSRFRPAPNLICSYFWLAFWHHQKT